MLELVELSSLTLNLRARLEPHDGRLMIETECEFVIHICIPSVSLE